MNEESFLDSIEPGVRIDYDFCMKIYSCDISNPGFADLVLKKIEDLGLKEIRQFYDSSVKKYEDKHNEIMKRVSEWYVKQCQEDYERQTKKWNSKNAQRSNYSMKQKEDSWSRLARLRKLL